MEISNKISDTATMEVKTYERKKEKFESCKNVSDFIKEAMSGNNEITIYETAEKIDGRHLAIIKKHGEKSKGIYENCSLNLKIEYENKKITGKLNGFSFEDIFFKDGGLESYQKLHKLYSAFNPYEITSLEYDAENSMMIREQSGGKYYIGKNFFLSEKDNQIYNINFKSFDINLDLSFELLSGFHGKVFGKSRIALPDKSEIMIEKNRIYYGKPMENGAFFTVYIPDDLAEMSEEEILENFSPEEYKKYEKTFKELFRILKELKIPEIDEIESDIFAKVEKFKEISERYSISNIYENFDKDAENFNQIIKDYF